MCKFYLLEFLQRNAGMCSCKGLKKNAHSLKRKSGKQNRAYSEDSTPFSN